MALDFFAGCVGGCAGILVGHPFDTIKVRLQTQDFRNPSYRGTFHCFQSILQRESVGGLYRGMSSPLGGVAVINAIVFGAYGNIQRRMSNPDALSSHFMAGFSAGCAQSIVTSPMELAKTRVQVQQGGTYRSPLQCIMQIARTEGVRGVYRGLGITIARDAPGIGVYFLSYELMTRTSSPEPISTMHVMLAGGLAGCVSWIATFPFDVLKSRLQVDGMLGPAKYRGAVDCFRQSARREGHAFIMRGLASTLLRAFPMNAATFTVVTWVFRLAGVGQEEDSGYYVPSDVEEERTSIKLQHDAWGIRATGLWDNLESRDKYLKGLFHWRKVMRHNIAGNFFTSEQNGIQQNETDDTQKGLVSKFVNGELVIPEFKSSQQHNPEEEILSPVVAQSAHDDETAHTTQANVISIANSLLVNEGSTPCLQPQVPHSDNPQQQELPPSSDLATSPTEDNKMGYTMVKLALGENHRSIKQETR